MSRVSWLTLLLVPLTETRLFAQGDDEAFKRRVQQAIDRGARQLKASQDENGTWKYGTCDAGMAALAAWTLLEARVPAADPAIEKAARVLRKQCGQLKSTYDASLAIIFLDRLGDARDRALIQALAVRVLAGQNRQGGWSYD